MASTPHGRGPLLAVQGLGVEFAVGGRTITAADDVSFEISGAEILALVGESGSGKSVTAMSLMGLLGREARVRGQAILNVPDGQPVELLSADASALRAIRGRRIGAVFQDPFSTFNPVMRIGRQIVEALDAHPQTRGRDAPSRTRELLARVGLDEPDRVYRSYPHELSGGQLQRAMIAMAISGEPDLLIADEPTTALDVTVQAGILDLLHELRNDMGTAILLITHDMGVVADLADEVLVMRDARVIERGPAERVFLSPELPYTKELLAAVPRVDEVAAAVVTAASDAPPAADVRDVTITYGSGRHPFVAVQGVSLTVPAGQTVGLVGESGSGKTTLGKAIARLVDTAAGTIMVGGTDLAALHGRALRKARADIGFVFQNPGDSLNPRARVGAIVAEPLQIHGDAGPVQRRERAADLLARVKLPADAIDRYPHQLSGGQRQRVSIARALVLRPRLVIADEPTSALDVAVQATILELIAELQRELGFGCLFISHDLAVVRQVSAEVVVLRAGQVVETGPADEVLSRPRDPYTQRLLASVPVPDPRVQRARRERALAAS
ncbi:MAG TPA: ABC transporter ATP-binding protein [Solirubrobacteraceae bacterium]|nr:ABC transporter ATP-binding protein [Solirubrobacteraceae bacterium]